MPLSIDPPRIRTNYHIGKDKFYPDPNDIKSLTDTPNVSSRQYNSLRGMLVPKKMNTRGFDESRTFTFQFNPEELKIQKEAIYNTRSYTGLDYTDYIWASGGEKTVQFNLFMDATSGAFNPAFGNALDWGVKNISDAVTKKPRGVLDDCELLESFVRPDVPTKGKIKIPKFSSGGIVPPNQFYPPPVLIFIYGNFYLEGILRSVDFTYSAWRTNLIPARAQATISFTVLEQEEVSIASVLNQVVPQISSASIQTTNLVPR